MAYSKEDKESILEEVFTLISRDGYSLRKACEQVKLSTRVFYDWIEADEKKAQQYARATQERHDFLFEEILEIADESNADVYVDNGETKIDGNTVQRSRLRVDARKWALSKMNPKKYGDKLDLTSKDEKIENSFTVKVIPPEETD